MKSSFTTPEYYAWVDMRRRCNNPTFRVYYNYGGRGIKVCERWNNSFAAFLEDMGIRPSANHSLDRIDNDGDYEPGNVRWSTKLEQDNNRRTNVILTIDGVSHTIAEWSRISGVEVSLLSWRIKHGWPAERLLSKTRTYNGWTKERNALVRSILDKYDN